MLDCLLEEEHLEIEGISGTSAGAMNAVVLAHGLTTGGRAGAREALAEFWDSVAQQVSFTQLETGMSEDLSTIPNGGSSPALEDDQLRRAARGSAWPRRAAENL